MKALAPALRILADSILADARTGGTFFGPRKVFLSTISDMSVESLEVFETLRRAGALSFARADLVAAMDPALVSASRWSPLSGVEYHFLVVE